VNARGLQSVFQLLDRHYGPQYWWPADTPFEVMVGAVLVQNTAWRNVISAIDRLKAEDLLDAGRLVALDSSRLASLIRPVGYFNVKARRLQAMCRWYHAAGGYRQLRQLSCSDLRAQLLQVHGIGPETADDILLYAFGHTVFVIDAYTRRLFGRLQLLQADAGYESLRRQIQQALPAETSLYNQYHALIVTHAKNVCRKRPLCAECCLADICPEAGNDRN
jgi:endonuclease-3 related protein